MRSPVNDALDRLARLRVMLVGVLNAARPSPDWSWEILHAWDAMCEEREQLREQRDAALESSDEYERQANRTLDRAVAAEAELQRLREGLRRVADALNAGQESDARGIARALLADRPDGDCEHEWVSARNEAVLSGLICVKCHALAAEPDGANTEGGEA